jgi:hypothetical protein
MSKTKAGREHEPHFDVEHIDRDQQGALSHSKRQKNRAGNHQGGFDGKRFRKGGKAYLRSLGGY